MCIAKSVGLGARNDVVDVRIVQTLLNLNSEAWSGAALVQLGVDGQIGPNTIEAIRAFETRGMGLSESDGLVTPGDATMARLLAGLPPGATKEKLGVVMPRAMPKRIDLYYEPLVKGMTRYGIDTPRQISMVVSQRIRAEDTFARLGGDEFGLLLSYCQVEKAIEIAVQLRQMVESFRIMHEGRLFHTGIIIGIDQT
eukprot:gene52383-64036_t